MTGEEFVCQVPALARALAAMGHSAAVQRLDGLNDPGLDPPSLPVTLPVIRQIKRPSGPPRGAFHVQNAGEPGRT